MWRALSAEKDEVTRAVAENDKTVRMDDLTNIDVSIMIMIMIMSLIRIRIRIMIMINDK